MRFINFLFYAILLICPLGALFDVAYPSVFGQKVYVYILMPILIIYSSILILKRDRVILNKFDLVLVVFFCYLFCRMPDYAHMHYFLALLIVYFVGKLSGKLNLKVTIVLMLASSILQIFIGELQILNLIESPNSMFKISGTFFNPAPYAGFLAMIVPLCYYKNYNLFKGRFETLFQIIVYIVMVGSVILLFSADSRAAFLAVIVSISYLYWNDEIVREVKSKLLAKKSYMILVMVSVIFICGFVYLYKYKSANGRLFIWTNSLTGIEKSPFLGNGIGSFKQNYMLFQRDYFENNTTSKYLSIADNVEYLYNDLLLIWFELGIVGLLLLSIMLYYLFAPKFNSKLSKPLKASCLTICIFSLFSYPSEIPAICIYLFFILGLISSIDTNHNLLVFPGFKKNGVYVISLSLLVLAVFYLNFCLSVYGSFKKWKSAIAYYDNGDFRRSKSFYDEVYSLGYLNNNPLFLDHYAKVLFLTENYYVSDLVSKRTVKIRPNVNNYLLYAESLSRQGKYELAERYYEDALFMVPKLFYGEYLLCKMYYNSRSEVKFKNRAKEFLFRSNESDQLVVKEMRDSVNKWLLKQ
ncbi:O-antigen ligase family protein [Sphingobacterium sp. JUb56]|uniref:O-antigen ligase family protein n=1 Tax=Sphingobacterium sp. JUb56 TaxID=2587145 RepID=UPI001612DD19|nr:O-antigen ligase family protein [Sphingobacterium sp. JUb56]MBB2950151.1 O-antigen ligase [Sphingobacterium sp. JUb56]